MLGTDELVQYEDLKTMLFGKALGVGVYRKVGVYLPDPTLVIKCAIDNPEQNVVEWRIWNEVSECESLRKWLAPCVAISKCGMFLLQKRAEFRPRAEYPKQIPTFCTDQKYSNYGWIDGQFVCCDYGGFIVTNGMSQRMKKAKWWE